MSRSSQARIGMETLPLGSLTICLRDGRREQCRRALGAKRWLPQFEQFRHFKNVTRKQKVAD
jgi:hypothetical protein